MFGVWRTVTVCPQVTISPLQTHQTTHTEARHYCPYSTVNVSRESRGTVSSFNQNQMSPLNTNVCVSPPNTSSILPLNLNKNVFYKYKCGSRNVTSQHSTQMCVEMLPLNICWHTFVLIKYIFYRICWYVTSQHIQDLLICYHINKSSTYVDENVFHMLTHICTYKIHFLNTNVCYNVTYKYKCVIWIQTCVSSMLKLNTNVTTQYKCVCVTTKYRIQDLQDFIL